jgi:hypothetical protein
MFAWSKSDAFLGRQVMAVVARASGINLEKVLRTWNQELSRGATDSASVAVSFLSFSESGFPAKKSRADQYWFSKALKGSYPIAKFLLLCLIAAIDSKIGKPRPEVVQFVKDPWMHAALTRSQ